MGYGGDAPGGPWATEVPGPALDGVRAVLLDTDGVITDTARLHAAAWKEAFDACLRAHGDDRPFDPDAEYRAHVDGASRLDGAAAFLASRALRLPAGHPGDPPGTGTVHAVAAAKDRLLTVALTAGPVTAWPDAVRLLRALRRAGVARAAVSASRHASQALRAAGVDALLDLVVDGREAARLGLPGKPDPALFRHAARRLGHRPDRTAVAEDAPAGTEAARRGGFHPVIGVDRTGGRATAELTAHGADLIVTDLTRLLRPAGG
ncbi:MULTISPECIES: HAD family hydrolase [Streptomycetaceae]|uniref:Beta-phosphoglucomutase family hydrolase n=1 Tax=Streptantibioticus cattleyicolor (strain ATCC 35852 / DSM 46488 / JCM 4925 / NBRC 14057 / NRRL 8057) TaxID=1003195 RepID=F8K1V4_STREN|nr:MULTISPECIES: HAD-IA family hydrolase [Streptomycetaceae]AEW92426.1 beta-phosphoglucomutase family hydrolase [Streptantibioticus cattleyicolor NRRL 8057 = DSM 46488]MYS57234.1 HAD-IA family hydrolase [Streptomyces sp. SID5468]CCB72791.1 conserved protein of unknown function [Streptantibioticus cattleyicolor NRRL 8057 = DSM 46488]